MTPGRTAYEAYRRFRADPYIVGWFELRSEVQDAWEAAAREVAAGERATTKEEVYEEAYLEGYAEGYETGFDDCENGSTFDPCPSRY